ncbi:transposase [Rhodococcus sp. ZPP]|nr:transposase [Rhodococcus sp. ZPP]
MVFEANTQDVRSGSAIPAVSFRRGPRRRKPGTLQADKDCDKHRRIAARAEGIVRSIARRGVDRNERPGRHRWKIERTIAWLTGYRRLTIRYERHGDHFVGFLHLAAAQPLQDGPHMGQGLSRATSCAVPGSLPRCGSM